MGDAQATGRGRGDLGERGGEAGDAHGADDAVGVRGDVGRRGLELREHDVRVADEHLGGACEPHAAPVALHDRLADLALERGELLGDRGRREVERVGGGRERAVLGDLAQHAQAAGIDHVAKLTNLPAECLLALRRRARHHGVHARPLLRSPRARRRGLGRELRPHPRRAGALPAAALHRPALHAAWRFRPCSSSGGRAWRGSGCSRSASCSAW